ncbi:DUF6531 domain-containing protein [Actinoallomurus soli]|uniref:DUF6531 domain-containing protein n=1 Tax=Actinoallomurus soli TaxID=2952535 RepID=UPI0020937AC5|nr:DUF6531 domain-containing protein [Actinoallomurus soli]MCO5968806.1 DUF6531 domain-containing protein [Actinoallomurus soli]
MSAGSRAVGKTVMKVAGGRLFPIGAFLRSPASRALVTAARSSGRAVRGSLRAGAEASGRARAFLARVLTKDPIDVASGEVVLRQVDAEFPGVLPLVLERTYLSSYRAGSLFGSSWASTLDQRIEIDSEGVCFAAEDGMVLTFPAPSPGTPVRPERGPLRTLAVTPGGEYTVTDPLTGRTAHFPGRGPAAYGTVPITAITDRNGNRIDFERDEAGTLRTIRHSGGYTVDVEVESGRVRALRLRTGDGPDADPVLVRFGYDEQGRLTEVVDSSGEPLRFSYDAQGRLTEWIDRNGAWYRYTYDAEGRGIRGEGRDGFLNAELAYLDGETVVTDSLGHRTTYRLNERGQMIAEIDPLGNLVRLEWDVHDRLLSRTDPLGATTRYTYGPTGSLVAVTRPDGREVTAVCDELGLPIEITEPDGAVWRQSFDARGNLLTRTDPLGATTRFEYDRRGGLVAVTDPLGAVTRIVTDDLGLPTAVTDPTGATDRVIRDAAGRITTLIDPLGQVTRLAWTPEGRLAARVSPGGETERWSYDDEGDLVEFVSAAGGVTRVEYGPFDVPTARTGPDGTRLRLEYDTELRLTTVTDPRGLVWRYEYDAAGRLTRETDFNGRVLTYAYDAAGRLVERRNGAGESVRYVHDRVGNVVEEHSGGTVTTFTHDAAGRLIRAVNSDADVRFERDAAGRVTAEVCNGRVLSSSYDAAGRRVGRRTASGARSAWRYDAAGRPAALQVDGGDVRFGYDRAGRETQRLFGPNVAVTSGWDAEDRLRAQGLWVRTPPRHTAPEPARLIHERLYEYRADGYVSRLRDSASGVRAYRLDPVGRVTAVRGEGWSEDYTYDTGGVLAHASWPTSAGPSTDGDALGEREYAGTRVRRAGKVRFEYDAQGRVVLRQHRRLSGKPLTWRYSWDAQDRLTGVTTPDGGRWAYRYDPLGRRIAKQRLSPDGGSVAEQVDFLWDGENLAEQAHTVFASGRTATRVTGWEWEPGTSRPIGQTERLLDPDTREWVDERFYAIVTDLVGTPTELVDLAGTVHWRRRTTVWGASPIGHTGGTDCPLRFPGQYFDAESGLSYNCLRYYDPATARYESADPLGLHPAPNPHAYVTNPMVEFDPLGLAPYRLSDNAVTKIPKPIREEYEKIAAMRAAERNGIPSPLGAPTPRINEATGNQKVFQGWELPLTQRPAWKGSLEWDVPGTDHRILERPDGKLGYAYQHDYSKPQLFPGPWYPEGGVIPRFLGGKGK